MPDKIEVRRQELIDKKVFHNSNLISRGTFTKENSLEIDKETKIQP